MSNIEELKERWDCKHIIDTINRITDGDNITLEDAYEHICRLCDCDITHEEVEAIYVEGRK